jgi:hypothetical protein
MEAYIDQIARGEIAVEENSTGRLGCCEYARARDGEVRNVLQCFCECDAVDETASNVLTLGQMPTRSQVRRIEEDVADRFRVPWVTGAVRVNPWVLVTPLAMCVEASLAGAMESTVWIPCVSFLFFLYTSITFMKTADSARSKMHVSFTSWAIAQVVATYCVILRHAVSASYDLVAGALVTMIAFSAWQVHFGDPGYLPELSPPEKSSNDGLCSYYIKNNLLRAKYCRITKRAIANYDHFCIWLGAPIGKRNHASFLVFLASVAFGGVLFVWKAHSVVADESFSFSNASIDKSNRPFYLLLVATRALGGALGCGVLLLRQCFLISSGMTTYESLHKPALLLHAKQVGSKFPSNVWGRGRWQQIWRSSLMFSRGEKQCQCCLGVKSEKYEIL